MPGFIGLTVYLFKHMIAYHQIISFALTRLFPLTLMATYTTSSSLSWRNDKTGDLPLSKYGLIGTVQLLTTSSMLVVACMTTMSFTILFWDPVQELWTKARDLDVGRADHAAVAAQTSLVNCIQKSDNDQRSVLLKRQYK